MAHSAVVFGDGKDLDPTVLKETLQALKDGKDIIMEGIGLANLNRWFKEHPTDPNSKVIIYQDADYTGATRGFRLNETVTNYQDIHFSGTWRGTTWSDKVSSVKVSGSVAFVVWEHADFGGNRLVLMPGTSVADLRHVGGGWHDQVSSSQVINVTELGTIFN